MGSHQKFDLVNQLNEIPLIGRQYVPKFWNLIEDEKEFGFESDKKPETSMDYCNSPNATSFALSPSKQDVVEMDDKASNKEKTVDLKRPMPFHQESDLAGTSRPPSKQSRLEKP